MDCVYFTNDLLHTLLDNIIGSPYLANQTLPDSGATMRFSDWVQFHQIRENVPAAAGLFQIKTCEGLLQYPHGRSSMYYYGYAKQLNEDLLRFRNEILKMLEVDEGELLVRWVVAVDTVERFQKHLDRFHAQFGSLPLGNELFLRKKASENLL